MQNVNVNQLVHSASPFYMAVSLQTWTVSGKNLDGHYPLGFATWRPKNGLITADARMGAALAVGESLRLEVIAVHADGTSSTLLDVTLNSDSGDGVVDLISDVDPGTVQVGDILYLQANYVPGGPPVIPLIALLFQVG